MQDNTTLKSAVRSLYDLQKLRIQAGNRIVAAFRNKLGIAPGASEDGAEDPHAKELLTTLREEFARVTDGVAKITQRTKLNSELLTTLGELRLIESYEQLLASENSHAKLIEWELENFPVWTRFLKSVKGCGPMMAGVLVSEIDIHKARYASSLWKLAGVDTVIVVDEATGELRGEGRSRKAQHLVPKTYVSANGEVTETRGISFNPRLKTKLLGVLAASFLKCGGPYRDVYVAYKFRIENDPRHANKSKLHRHNMAMRYMIKMFLIDLYKAWRELEGLPVHPPYHEAKLGHVHSQAA